MMISSHFYFSIFNLLLIVIFFGFLLLAKKKNDNTIIVSIVVFLTILLTTLIGFRSIDDTGFGDTALYVRIYERAGQLGRLMPFEPGYNFLMILCKNIGLSIQLFFCLLGYLYIYFQYKGSCILLGGHSLLVYFLIIGAFSFNGYAINGIRNGLGCSILFLALPYIFSDQKNKWVVGGAICFIASSIHSSTILPALCFFAARFYFNTFDKGFKCWIASIFFSLLLGSFFITLFTGLGFDDRLDGYLETPSRHGFRWDFLLYSSVPILLAYYYIKILDRKDRIYEFLISSYMLSNALWILVINASFSNRFAYLSWFLYPLVIAYPLIVFDTPNYMSKQKLGLSLYLMFTLIMYYLSN